MARIFGNSTADMTKPLNGAFVMYAVIGGATARRAAAGFIPLSSFFPCRRQGNPHSREEPIVTYVIDNTTEIP